MFNKLFCSNLVDKGPFFKRVNICKKEKKRKRFCYSESVSKIHFLITADKDLAIDILADV